MSAAAMAAFEARAGAALVRRFANATADFGGGRVIDVVFSDPSLQQDLAGLAAIGRDPTIDYLPTDLPDFVVERGTPVIVRRTVGAVTTVVHYIARSEPVPHTEHGTVLVPLEREP